MRRELWQLLLGFNIQRRNIHALMLRDMMMRYGRENIGFIWVVLEPMILTAGVMTLWSILYPSGKYGITVIEFVLTGYMPLTLWRHLTNQNVTLFRRTAHLLYHRGISIFDVVCSRFVLEFAGTTAALLIVWIVLNTAGLLKDVARWDLLLLGWLLMGWLAGACGILIAVVTERSEASDKFVGPFQYLTLPISGAFAMVDWFPDWAQTLLLLNPMVHSYELFRAGYFGPSVVTHYSISYLVGWSFLLTYVGLVAVCRTRSHVQLN